MATISKLSKVLNISTNKGNYILSENHVYECTYNDKKSNSQVTVIGILIEIQSLPTVRTFSTNPNDNKYTLRFDCSTDFRSNIIEIPSFDVDSVKYCLTPDDIDKFKIFLDNNISKICIEKIKSFDGAIGILAPSMTTINGIKIDLAIAAEIIETTLPETNTGDTSI